VTAPTGARFQRLHPADRHHYRHLRPGQGRRDLRRLGRGLREWAAAAVDAVQFIVRFGGYLVARFLILSAVIGLVTLVMGAGR
jgi:hypothetical protein